MADSSDSPVPSIPDFLNPPPDDATLWRYMPITQFLRLLQTRTLWHSSLDLLGDPFEGSLTRITTEERDRALEALAGDPKRQAEARAVHAQPKLVRKGLFVSCWHRSDNESEAMWRLYGSQEGGLAIRTTVERLRGVLTTDEAMQTSQARIWVTPVTYINYDIHPMPMWNVLGPAVFKRLAFRHESEVRSIFLNFDWTIRKEPVTGTPTFDYSLPSPPGFAIPIDPLQLIESVAVNPLTSDWVKASIEDLARTHGLAVPITRSELGAEPTW